MENSHRLKMVERDEWLRPVEGQLLARHEAYEKRLDEIRRTAGSLVDYANGHRYFGWQYDSSLEGWWFREWLPGACDVYLFGDFNGWQRTELRLDKDAQGVWSIFLPEAMYGHRLRHGSLYKIHVHGRNGWLDRIPAYATRVVQDERTKDFTAQFWIPRPFDWSDDTFDIARHDELLIYEAHVGMAQERPGVGTYREFADRILPVIARDGYNTVQLMAVAEHPYYGSFGYHVSSLFAPSSRFGTPEELKGLIRRAHELGLAVIMDLVHSHYVRNLNEGINELDGTDHLYSPAGPAGDQPHWDSKLFDYGKPQVEHFLLSNIKYWLEEYRFDGFRFDGVTSMLYHHHGYVAFDSRDRYFDEGVNEGAITYLSLANRLAHDLRPSCVTIAEDVSGMPGICFPQEEGGVGFDYRLGMAIPDYWIKQIEEVPDEQWDIREMWSVMTDRLPGVKTVAYAESHDQALVGDKTIAFRLMDKEMYTHMDRASENLTIDRGMALHKMIRLMTVSTGGDAYLRPRPPAVVARRGRSAALLVAGGIRPGNARAGQTLRHIARRLSLLPANGRPQPDDRLFARAARLRLQLASGSIDPRLPLPSARSRTLRVDPLDRRTPFRRHRTRPHRQRTLLFARRQRRRHDLARDQHLQHLAHGGSVSAPIRYRFARRAATAPVRRIALTSGFSPQR